VEAVCVEDFFLPEAVFLSQHASGLPPCFSQNRHPTRLIVFWGSRLPASGWHWFPAFGWQIFKLL